MCAVNDGEEMGRVVREGELKHGGALCDIVWLIERSPAATTTLTVGVTQPDADPDAGCWHLWGLR